MISLRLSCSTFWVEVRLLEINGRWIASADTVRGPSLGLGKGAIEAVERALEPFAPPGRRADGEPAAGWDPVAVGNPPGSLPDCRVAYHPRMWLELLRLVGWPAVVILAVSLVFLLFTHAAR